MLPVYSCFCDISTDRKANVNRGSSPKKSMWALPQSPHYKGTARSCQCRWGSHLSSPCLLLCWKEPWSSWTIVAWVVAGGVILYVHFHEYWEEPFFPHKSEPQYQTFQSFYSFVRFGFIEKKETHVWKQTGKNLIFLTKNCSCTVTLHMIGNVKNECDSQTKDYKPVVYDTDEKTNQIFLS